MALDESEDKKNISMKINDINILIDKEVEDLLSAEIPLTIDYYKNSYNHGFSIEKGTNC